MSEDLVQVLTRFHREVLLPDVERIVQASETRVRDEMHGVADGLAVRMKDLETELHMALTGLKRVEERLGRVEQRLERVEERLDGIEGRLEDVEARLGSMEEALQRTVLRSELDTLKHRVTALQKRIQDIEARL